MRLDDICRVLGDSSKPWLIVGKGPSLSKPVAFSQFNTLTLNHACKVPANPAACLFVDIEAFEDAYDTIPTFATVILPWRPHVNMKSGSETLFSLNSQKLDKLLDQDRVAAFNSTTSNLPAHPQLPIIRLRYFSAVGAVNLLAHAGHKQIFTIGVDTGSDYAPMFDQKDRLANGRKSFDIQFEEFDLSAKKYGLTIERL